MIENYPRFGQRLSPTLLRDFLPAHLRDLGESVWQHYTHAQCESLSEEVIQHARREALNIRRRLGHHRLPALPAHIRLHHLPLEVRTVNCLITLGLEEDLSTFARLTINRLFATRNFGVKSLIDLLVTLESLRDDWASNPVIGESACNEDEIDNFDGNETISDADITIIVEHCERRLPLPLRVRSKILPPVPAGLMLHSLGLRLRTYNALRHAGFVRQPERLSGRSLDELLCLKNFGRGSLQDLLINLKPFFINSVEAQESFRAALETLMAEARLLEATPFADKIMPHDARLGVYLARISTEAANAREVAARILSNIEAEVRPLDTSARIKELRARIVAASSMSLEQELASFVAHVKNERNREIYIRRHGFNGRAAQTLESIAVNHNMTRERVRQICNRAMIGFGKEKAFAPRLDAALDFISANLPALTVELSEKLRASGITDTAFDIESLADAAILFQREVPFMLEDVGERKLVIASGGNASETNAAARKIITAARRKIEHWGAATIDDTCAQASPHLSLPETVATHLITGQDDFEWLDEAGGWFWLKDVKRNRVLNRVAKILRVASDVRLGELRSGIRRHYRMEGFAPPQRVLAEMCRRVGWCVVDDEGRVTAMKLPETLGVMGEAETIMHEILQAHDSIMVREDFERACLARGMNRTTFFVYLDNSAIIVRHARGVYGLRGADVEPGVIEAMIPRRTHSRVLKDYGWLPDGRLWLGFKLSQSIALNGVCSIPVALSHYIQGEFQLVNVNGSFLNTFVARNSSAWGFGSFVRQRGGEAGDVFVIVFDLQSRRVTPHLGDETLLNEYQYPDEIKPAVLVEPTDETDIYAL